MSAGTFRAPPVEDLQPHFPQYTINAFAAVGGMGAVYRATQNSVDRPVALKILPAEMAGDESFQKRFALEAKAMAKLSHRNLVQLYDFGETNGIFWMIQEWVQGRTIFEVIYEEKRLSPNEAAALVAQACEGLGYAHKQGVVHRDVKPANMMVNSEGILKLMDFGLAGVYGEGIRTQGGARFATEEYAAPEMWDTDGLVDHRVDIFALGVLLYEALTGKRPTGKFRVPSELIPGLDKRFDDIVVRAMQRKRENRYQSCSELLRALRTVVTSPAKVQLHTKKPATGALKLNTGSAPVKTPKPITGGTLKKATGAVPVAQPVRPASPPTKTKSNKGVITLVSVLLLLGLLGAGWMALSGGKEKENPSKQTEQDKEPSKGRDDSTPPDAPPGDPGTGQVKTGPKPDDPRPRPDPHEPPKPREVVKELDDGLRTDIGRAFSAYSKVRKELTGRYLANCTEEEKKAVTAGDLDGVLFWQAEAQAVKAGDAPANDEAALPRALTLRKAWRARIDPLKAALVPAQSAYLEKCRELLQGRLKPQAQSAVEERLQRAVRFEHFVALCAGEAPPFKVEKPPGDPLAALPAEVKSSYQKATARLSALETGNKTVEMIAFVKQFGRSLVRDERELTRQRKIAAAKSVRVIKDEMLARLATLESTESGPKPVAGRSLVVVRGGEPTRDCLFEKKNWRRRGKALLSQEDYARLTSKLGIGPGDFEVHLKLVAAELGGKGIYVGLGDLYLYLDSSSGAVAASCAWKGSKATTKGVQVGSLVRPNQVFACVIRRTGGSLEVLLNEKPALKMPLHSDGLGLVRINTGKVELGVESFELKGALIDAPHSTVLHTYHTDSLNVEQTQLLKTPDRGLLCMYSVKGGGTAGVKVARSRDGGSRWDDPVDVTDFKAKNRPVYTFSAASNTRRDEIWMGFAQGTANHRVYIRQGRNGGRNWQQPVDVTAQAKEAGANVRFAAQGLVVTHFRGKVGRIILPMLAGGKDEMKAFLLISESGRDWKKVGPLSDIVWDTPEIVEGVDGTIYLAMGVPKSNRSHGRRMWIRSKDGGDTWSQPEPSPLPDAGYAGGLSVIKDSKGKATWFYATVDGPVGEVAPAPSNLSLFVSTDGGKTWRVKERFHFGKGSYPSIVAVDSERLGVAFRRQTWTYQGDHVRFLHLAK